MRAGYEAVAAALPEVQYEGEPAITAEEEWVAVDVVTVPDSSTQVSLTRNPLITTFGTLAIRMWFLNTESIDNVLKKVDPVAAHIFNHRNPPGEHGNRIVYRTPSIVRGGIIGAHRLITVSVPWQSWRQYAA
ncbi:MAG: hypothetical protein OXE53_13065 [Deltaproteobacteria bacterium]|nr:hypothetical protein [Deltaproteobacteria bacterium]